MFSVDLNDSQWLQCKVYTDTTMNKVGMHTDVVVANGRASCDVNGRIWSNTYCGCIILECGTLGWGQMDVQFAVSVATNGMRAVIGASLSELHTSVTALWKCVYMLACGHIP